eukprot:6205259-Pleurochrysis_carterae.AAC.1
MVTAASRRMATAMNNFANLTTRSLCLPRSIASTFSLHPMATLLRGIVTVRLEPAADAARLHTTYY